ncbi:MAG TPA: metal-dependent hydrolase, partial [Candidatus Cloacimonas sp.]|nr:metal-dependent hydrolase [Candidatus Cloacimonas sp.]
MELQYFGHSTFLFTNSQKQNIIIDPYLNANPLSPVKSNQVKADYIILTHAHSDHMADALTIADRHKTTIICVSELASIISKSGFRTHPLQIGGAFRFDFGRVKFVPAFHGSSTMNGVYAGLAAGAVFTVEGKTIYHCGDTGIFGDMKLIGEI